MMQAKRKMVMALVCALLLTGVFTAVRISMAAKDKVTAAYDKKVQELQKQKKYKSGIAQARLSCGTGEKILVVTPADSVYADDRESIEAAVYQYADGKVKLIGKVSSDGTAYPLQYTKNAILSGGNHRSSKLVIKNGKATLKEITRMNMESGKAVLTTYSVENGKKTKVSSKKISQKKAEKLDYYANASGAKIISFE